MVKGHKSTVTSVAWSPDSVLLASGCTDYKARIHSAYIDDLDKGGDEWVSHFGENAKKFGEQCVEFGNSKGWVNSVAFSPSGKFLAFAGHGSTLHFASLTSSKPQVQDINQNGLPFMDITFTDENTLVGVGFDMNPTVYSGAGGKWAFKSVLDTGDKKKPAAAPSSSSAAGAAAALWRNADSRGVGVGSEIGPSSDPTTRHTNAISNVRVVGAGELSTCGIDGRVLFWKV
jgi:actin related protein 2/3 complex subunit 1A/1B